MEDQILAEIEAATPDMAQVSRLRVDALKWIMSKRAPKVYGDKLALQGDPENPVQVATALTVTFVAPQR